MRYYQRGPTVIRFGFGGGTTGPAVKYFMIACAAAFVLQVLFPRLVAIFGLIPYAFWHSGFVWQLLTFHFLHGGLMHLLLNLFVFWMFGVEIERLLGTKRFITYIAICGVGAGAMSLIATPNLNIPIIGASGVVYGVLLAFGLFFPERYIFLMFLFPIKAKHLVLIFGGIELLYTISGGGATGIAHAAHLGGMVFGAVYLYWARIRFKLRNAYYRAKLRKLQRRHRVNDDDRPRWYH